MRFAEGWDKNRVQKMLRRKRPDQLAEFIKARHDERFLQPLRVLKAASGNEQGFGFAMLAICSLLVETIQSYRDGLPTTDRGEFSDLTNLNNIPQRYRLKANECRSGRKIFQKFFSDFRSFFENMSGFRFYKNIRCGLLHQGQTKRNWRIARRSHRVWTPNPKTVYRNNFAEALEESFEKYLAELRNSRWTDKICRHASRKVWWLLRLS